MDTTAKIGHNLGWRTIIFTAVEPLQESYRLSLRAVDVETGKLRGTKNYVLNGSDPILISIVNPNMTVERLSEREVLLQPFDGKRNNFNLTVTANKNVYYNGEELFVTLRSSKDCIRRGTSTGVRFTSPIHHTQRSVQPQTHYTGFTHLSPGSLAY